MKKDIFNSFEAEDFRIMDSPSLNTETSMLLIPLECWFDCDKKFGLNILTNDDVWLNLFAEYNPMTEELRMFYDVDTPEKSHQREYIMTDEELKLLKTVIKQDIEKRNQMTCREFYLVEYVEHYADGIELECREADGQIVVCNKTDNFILYAEEKGGRLENHIGHSVELAAYGECIAIECTDCNEVLYDTDTEELKYSEEQQGGMTMQ